jgi:hypothetical protein
MEFSVLSMAWEASFQIRRVGQVSARPQISARSGSFHQAGSILKESDDLCHCDLFGRPRQYFKSLGSYQKGGAEITEVEKGGPGSQCPVRFLHVTTSKYYRKEFLPEAIIYLTT